MVEYQCLEERLVHTLMSGWKRRGCSLVQVGLHSYMQPEYFWDAGFDVCAVDDNTQALNQAFERSGPRVEYQLAKFDSLPFDDDSYDYGFVAFHARKDADMQTLFRFADTVFQLKNAQAHTQSNTENHTHVSGNTHKILDVDGASNMFTEATRVAQKGIIILCKNAFALRPFEAQGRKVNPFALWGLCKHKFPKASMRMTSGVIIPRFLRSKASELRNDITMHTRIFHCGGLLGICLNFHPRAVTGLGALVKASQKTERIEERAVNSVGHKSSTCYRT